MLKNLPDGFGAFVISLVVVVGFIALLLYVTIHGVQDNPTLQSLIGTLGAGFVTVIQYWIGSSSGSKAKDTVIASQATSTNQAAMIRSINASDNGVKVVPDSSPTPPVNEPLK